VQDVILEPTLMKTATTAIQFDGNGNIRGWDEVTEWQIEVKNTRDLPVTVEVSRHFAHQFWDLQKPEGVQFEKVDLDTIRYRLTLKPRESRKFEYTHTLHQGNNQDR
jgi:hypothetical protein